MKFILKVFLIAIALSFLVPRQVFANDFQSVKHLKDTSETKEAVNHEWIDSLLNKLGDQYYYNDKYPSIWYLKNNNDGAPERKEVVFTLEFKGSATFQEGIEGGRETVRYAKYENVHISPEGVLTAVNSYDQKSYSFNELSMSWRENK